MYYVLIINYFYNFLYYFVFMMNKKFEAKKIIEIVIFYIL